MRASALVPIRASVVGIDKGRTEVAQRLLAKDFGSDVVREVTGLSVSEIDAMRHSSNGS